MLGRERGLHQEDNLLTHGPPIDLGTALNEGGKIVVKAY